MRHSIKRLARKPTNNGADPGMQVSKLDFNKGLFNSFYHEVLSTIYETIFQFQDQFCYST